MKSKLAIYILIAGLAVSLTVASSAYSQEPVKEPPQEPVMMGGAGVEGRIYDVNGNKAKFHEYSDIKSGGVFGNADVTYVSPDHFVWFQATDPGYDTQRYRLETGSFGKYKFWFDYNEIIHNIATDAKTFYHGAGSNTAHGYPEYGSRHMARRLRLLHEEKKDRYGNQNSTWRSRFSLTSAIPTRKKRASSRRASLQAVPGTRPWNCRSRSITGQAACG